MSQSQIVKLGIIPVVFIVTVGAAAQRLTHSPDGITQNESNTEPSVTLSSAPGASDRTEKSIAQLSTGDAKNQKIKPVSESPTAPFFHLSKKLARWSSFSSAIAPFQSQESQELFLSLQSANKTVGKFLVQHFAQQFSRVVLQGVSQREITISETTGISSSVTEQPDTITKSEAIAQTPEDISTPPVPQKSEVPQKPEPVTVAVKSRELPKVDRPTTVTDKASFHWSEENLLFELFGTPDAPGVLAIGTAEGTVTATGQLTSAYWGHTDPGNGADNLGIFSYQHGASSPRQADWRQLKRLQRQVETIIGQAEQKGITLSRLELVAGADLLNQSPAAGMSYVHNLKQARAKGFKGINGILEARVMSFVNPETGVLEAAGFGNNWEILRHDQWRRLVHLKHTLEFHEVI